MDILVFHFDSKLIILTKDMSLIQMDKSSIYNYITNSSYIEQYSSSQILEIIENINFLLSHSLTNTDYSFILSTVDNDLFVYKIISLDITS